MTPARHAASRAPRTPWWDAVVQWRNWRLPVKLAALLVVPALLAVASGVVQIQREVQRANRYADIQQLVKLRGALMPLMGDLRTERTLSVQRLSGGAPADPATLERQTREVDGARAAVRRTTSATPKLDEVSASRYRDAVRLLRGLPELRRQVTSRSVAASGTVFGYSAIIKGLLDLDRALVNQFGDPELSGPATALYDLEVAKEQVHLQHVIMLQALGPGHRLDKQLLSALQESDMRFRDKLDDFRAVATLAEERRYRKTVTGPAVSQRTKLVQIALAQGPSGGPRGQESDAGTALPIPVKDWNHSSETTGRLMEKAQHRFADQLRTGSARLQDRTSNRAGVASVILLAVLLLAIAIGVVIGRYLLRSLAVLHSTAVDVAERQLPAVVASIREGHGPHAAIDPVPVHTTEELGQLARAFGAVHGQAVRLAVEQATMRSDLRNTLVNLSRRSQSLVERQLRLMEQLEQHEEDPDQLSDLFKLDHLATRMRRNNENLMVLSGGELSRAFTQLVPLGNVLRAAVSEIEHYQRVMVRPAPAIEVIGYAAGDLARLIAELLDNATAFSPPDAPVAISSAWQHDGSVLVDILDRGIGMSDGELAEANRRVAAGTSVEVPTSRQMGLFVVGRLAGRHGIHVRLSVEQDFSGLRAFVYVPAQLVKADPPIGAGQEGSPMRALAAKPPGSPGPPSGPPSSANGAVATHLRSRGHAHSTSIGDPPETWARSGNRPAPVGGHATRDPGWAPVPQQPSVRGFDPDPGTGRDPGTDTLNSSWFEPATAVRAPAGLGAEGLARPPAPPAAQDRAQPDGAGPPNTPMEDDHTHAGLPKRVPRTSLAPELAEPRAPAVDDEVPKTPDASRTHRFLSSYQAGIRQARPDQM